MRPERETDFPQIYEFIKTAFATARHADGDEQDFVNRLRRDDGYIPELALVAEEDDQIIGYLMLVRVFVETQPILLLTAVAVTIERRNRGLGAQFINEALQRAKQLGHRAVLVLGDPAYYSRFGFRTSASFGIKNSNGFEDQYVMALELVRGALSSVRGIVTLPS